MELMRVVRLCYYLSYLRIYDNKLGALVGQKSPWSLSPYLEIWDSALKVLCLPLST
jgi:hypothetical protein